jgi:hypothetical protein
MNRTNAQIVIMNQTMLGSTGLDGFLRKMVGRMARRGEGEPFGVTLRGTRPVISVDELAEIRQDEVDARVYRLVASDDFCGSSRGTSNGLRPPSAMFTTMNSTNANGLTTAAPDRIVRSALVPNAGCAAPISLVGSVRAAAESDRCFRGDVPLHRLSLRSGGERHD